MRRTASWHPRGGGPDRPALRRGRALIALLGAALVVPACTGARSADRSSTPPPASSAPPTETPATTFATWCSGSSPCAFPAGRYTIGESGVIPGLGVTLPDGWSSHESNVVQLELTPPGQSDASLILWQGMAAVKSAGPGHGTVMHDVGTTPAALTSWLTGDPDFHVVSEPAPANVGQVETTALTVGVSDSARYGGPDCPDNPRCAALLTKPFYSGHDFFAIGGDEEVRLYLGTLTTGGSPRTFIVALDAPSPARLRDLVRAAQPVIDSVVLPPPRGAESGRIVFSNDPLSSAHHQLYIEGADGSNARQLLASNFDDISPTLSPDGRWVVFTRESATSDRIFVVAADGSNLTQLRPGGCPSRCGDAVEGHAWSPDMSQILFTRAEFVGSAKVPAHVELWIMNTDGSGAHPLTHESTHGPGAAQDDDAAWSPDGTHVVFLHWVYGSPDRFEIATIPAGGGDIRRVTPVGLDSADPGWSPDGSLIVFQSPPDTDSGGVMNVYTIHPDGTGLQILTAHLGGFGSDHPAWSPDGSEIVFSHAPSGPLGGDLFVMNRDGSDLHVLRVTPLNENGAFWGDSPD
jgi:Tol biopolymer transport system component